MRLIISVLAIFAINFFAFTTSCRENSGKPNEVSKTTNKPTNTMPNNSGKTNSVTTSSLPTASYEIVNTYKHDADAFTQGLIFHDGLLYESTGQEGESTLRKVELETGKVKQKINNPDEVFAEGMTLLNGKFYQITWKDEVCYVYDFATFKKEKEFRYTGDGWGLTNDGTNLIMSDGSHQIKFINPNDFKTVKTINVFREDGTPQIYLNELEYVKGEIWANIWHSDNPRILGKPNHIARINPENGKLLGWINLDGISPDDVKRGEENTLNGIAYDATADRIFVTGKRWKKLFEIKLK